MSINVILPKNFAAKLAKAVQTAQEADEDIKEVIETMLGELKPVPKSKAKGKGKTDEAKAMIKAIGKPPRGATAYNLFCSKNRTRVAGENPDADFGEVTRLVAAEWKELSNKEKAPFTKAAAASKAKAEKAKVAYEAKKKAYEAGEEVSAPEDDEEDAEEKPAKKGRKAPTKPAPKGKGKGKAKAAKESEDEEEPEAEASDEPEAATEDEAEAEEEIDYSKKTLAELKALCKERKIKFDAKAKKADLVELLAPADEE